MDLGELVLQQLTPHLHTADRGKVSGPKVVLRPAGAVAMGLVLHKLATNAIKYGALSDDSGRVAIAWTVETTALARAVVLTWTEQDGPSVTAPTRQGFGTELIRRQVERGLRGRIETSYDRGGLRATLSLPLDVEPRVISEAEAALGPGPGHIAGKPAQAAGVTEMARQFGQADKWIFCLTAAKLPRLRSENDEANTADA